MMKKSFLLSTSNYHEEKIIKVRSPYRLSLIIKELKRNNVKFKINKKRNWFEIAIDNSKKVKVHQLTNRAKGSSVFTMIQQQSIKEAIPSTTNTPPPNRKKDKDLSDR